MALYISISFFTNARVQWQHPRMLQQGRAGTSLKRKQGTYSIEINVLFLYYLLKLVPLASGLQANRGVV